MTPQLSLAPTVTDGVPGGTQSMTGADHAGAPMLSRAPLNRRVRRAGGRRTRMIAHRMRGHVVRAVGVGKFVPDVALEATIRAAALHHSVAPPISIVAADVHQKQRVAPRSTTILFVVDASWSMAVARRMRAARGAMFALLADAYLRRDRVGLITFRDRRASVRLAPTRAISVARKALATIPIGGKTPLASALVEAARVFRREHVRQPHADALMVIVTDAAANVSVAGGAPLQEAADTPSLGTPSTRSVPIGTRDWRAHWRSIWARRRSCCQSCVRTCCIARSGARWSSADASRRVHQLRLARVARHR